MTTKAHEFRAQAERSGPKKAKRAPSKLVKHTGDAAQPGGSVTGKKRGVGKTATRHPSEHAERRGGPALEDSATKPSRKSTRKSVDHTKRTTNLQLKAQRKSGSPTSVAERAKGRSGKR
mgnify:CR=1 FL=1